MTALRGFAGHVGRTSGRHSREDVGRAPLGRPVAGVCRSKCVGVAPGEFVKALGELAEVQCVVGGPCGRLGPAERAGLGGTDRSAIGSSEL